MGIFVGEATSPVLANTDGSFGIAQGDLLIYLANADAAYPLNEVTHGASEAADQQTVHDAFLGVALSAVRADSNSAQVRAAVNGLFDMIASGNIQFGSLVGSVTTGTALEKQKVKAVTNKKYAIGTAQSTATDGQRVQVRIKSVVFDDGRVAIAS